MELLDSTNSLTDMLLNPELLEIIFRSSLIQEILMKPKKYSETLKKNLRYDLINFRRNELLKRSERGKLKELGKELSEIYKEGRVVFEYLKKESWIFDYSFLYEIVIEEVETSNRNKFLNQINKKYIKLSNLRVCEDVLRALQLE